MGLTFVPTPLGNLRDITLRALDVLRACDVVVAEDTRVARRLFGALEIAGKLILSYREQNAAAVTAEILARAATQNVAVVTDAGMPGVSDPGRELIVAAREAGVAVEVLPGPVAFIVAAVLSGFELTGLEFGGFLPRTAARRDGALRAAAERGAPTAWYESPQRIAATLEALNGIAPEAHVFVGRELTKVHEQQILGTPAEALAQLERPVRGEIVLVVQPPRSSDDGPPQGVQTDTADGIDVAIDALLDLGMPVSEIARALAPKAAGGRSEAYPRAAARKRARGKDPT